MRCQIWKMAAFCGIEVLTYCILSNHFHILARFPPKQELPDAELVRRYAILYDDDDVAAYIDLNPVREALFGKAKRKWSPPEVDVSGEDRFCFARRRRTMRGDE